jgi:hypothetical protein
MRRVAGLNHRTLALGVSVVVLVGLILGAAGIGVVAGAHNHPAAAGATASATHASPTPAAQNISTTSITIGVTTNPGITFPTDITFWTNVSYGVIGNTSTWVWIVAAGTSESLIANGSGTVNSNNITDFTANGVPYENYTWTVDLNQTSFTPNCADASCSDLIDGASGTVTFTVWAKEAGAANGGGGGWATNSLEATQLVGGYPTPDFTLQSTLSTVTFVSPGQITAISDEAVPYYQPVNISVNFDVNTSYLFLENSTFNVSLQVLFDGSIPFALNISLNDTLDATSLNGSSSILFNGTIDGVLWSNVSYSLTLNYTNLGFASFAAMAVGLGTGGDLYLIPWVNASGASAGGISAGVGDTGAAFISMITGTTLINTGAISSPAAYQALPFTQTAWLNLSFVQPYLTDGNATISGWFKLFDLNHPALGALATFSLNDSVNTVNPDGVSLVPVANETTATGTPFVNYTLEITITPASLGKSWYGDELYLTEDMTVLGAAVGGVTASLTGLVFLPTPLAANPTTLTTGFTVPVSGYIDVSTVPYLLNWTIATNGPITPTQTSFSLAIIDTTIPAPIAWDNFTAVPGQTNYNVSLSPSTFTTCTNTPICAYTAPTDDFYFTLVVVENGIGAPTNGSIAVTTNSIGPAFFIGTAATITLLSPQGATPTLYTGNITFATYYAGFFISGANLTVTSGTVVVFTALMTQLVAGVPSTAVWDATAAGTYKVTVAMSLTSSSTPVYANQTLTVLSSAGALVYQNSSTYHNVTLLGSLSPAVAGTILLLVGLIVGMIVALLVGRMMWGGSKPQEPPQQWEQGQPAAGTGATDAGTGSAESAGTDTGTPPTGSS